MRVSYTNSAKVLTALTPSSTAQNRALTPSRDSSRVGTTGSESVKKRRRAHFQIQLFTRPRVTNIIESQTAYTSRRRNPAQEL